MNRPFPHATYPLGLTLFALLLAFYKSVRLMNELGGGGTTFLNIVGLDALYLSLVFLIALLQSSSRLKSLRIVFAMILFFLTLLYLVDTFVLLALDTHASLFEIGRYTPELTLVLSFFDIGAYLAVFIMLVSVFVLPKATPTIKKAGLVLLVVSLLVTGIAVVSAPPPLRTYAILSSHDFLEGMRSNQRVLNYTEEEISFYAGLRPATTLIPPSKPNIILLVVESLSSINSNSMSGMPGLLDGFDELAEEGVLFKNFFANHQASEGGLIALLGGFPPMHFPTATPYMFDEFAIQASVIAEYQKQGYFAEFLTNADLNFIGLDRFLNGLGLDRSRGRDDVVAMRLAPRVVQDAPSDAYLYRETLKTVKHLTDANQPFLLTIASTSTHLPYTHPEGGPDTPEAVWEWSMQQLKVFYARLYQAGFFEHGILLITGDHRQMRPLTDVEIDHYGDSARARVPLLVIGKGYPAGGIDDRFFQQSDLLRMLGKVKQAGISLSPQPVWVERYNRKYGRIELINNLSVFDEADQGRHEYRVKSPGKRLEWQGDKPEFARRLETRIHTQRSLHQQVRSRLNSRSAENH